MASHKERLVKNENEITTKEEQLLNAPYGQQGAVIISHESADGSIVYGDFYCIMALRDDVVLKTTNTNVNWQVDDVAGNPAQLKTWTQSSPNYDIPLPVGMPFYGTFKSIELKDQSAIQGYCEECPKLIAYYR
tara:strand:- start:5553 stop:5951 length:399 start_codon:yes stop_codon:yes gene_type:complete